MSLIDNLGKLDTQPTSQSVKAFVNADEIKPEFPDLTGMTLDELATNYHRIDQQSQLFKGLILLEARSRFPDDNNAFGEWIQGVKALCLDGQPARTRYMNFAKYFNNKDRSGISLTACYEISRPDNADVADKVYEYAFNQNLSVAEIKNQIKTAKQELGLVKTPAEKVNKESLDYEKLEKVISNTTKSMEDLTPEESLYVLKECIKQIKYCE
jgi:hypothetical protein